MQQAERCENEVFLSHIDPLNWTYCSAVGKNVSKAQISKQTVTVRQFTRRK